MSPLDAGELLFGDQRADRRARVERVADGELAGGDGEYARDELLTHGGVDHEARAGVAGLAGVVEDPPGDRARGGLEVRRVGEHDVRALAAELERDRLAV